MATVILDDVLAKRLRAERAASGGDRYDEVWEGTYMMAPIPNSEHQEILNGLATVFQIVIGWAELGRVFPGVNVSDRTDDWERNYRVPDVAIFLNDSKAVDHETFWLGGPDFAVEVISPGDQSRQKLEFYADVETRELLVLDRNPWQLELYRLSEGSLQMVASAVPDAADPIVSEVLGLTFQLQNDPDRGRPRMQVTHGESKQTWTV